MFDNWKKWGIIIKLSKTARFGNAKEIKKVQKKY